MSLLLGVAIIVVGPTHSASAALLFVRRGAPEGSYFSDGDRASGVFGVLGDGLRDLRRVRHLPGLHGTAYDARSGAETEALAVIQQSRRRSSCRCRSHQAEVHAGQLECYGRYVVHQEWPRMERETIGDTINPWALALFRSLKGARARGRDRAVGLTKSGWTSTSVREAARLDRIHGAVGIIPTSIWIVLFLTGSVVFVYMLFFADSAEMARSQAMLIAARRRR